MVNALTIELYQPWNCANLVGKQVNEGNVVNEAQHALIMELLLVPFLLVTVNE